ncbi:MAG TPA: hypothetical protein VLV87_12355 [Gammaproteobacteria bacterium]|nr:hypothetical protein [Gammaproteobacteria bacterium]
MKNWSFRRPRRAGLPMAVLLAALSGCMYMNHDETHAPGMDAVVGQSFATVQDAFLIKDACIDNFKAKYCSQLQVVQGYYYVKDPHAPGAGSFLRKKLPADPQILSTSPEAAARLIWVPKGTRLKVVQLLSRSMGQYRRCWVVYATLPQLPADRVAEVPACLQWAPESAPMWFHAQALPPAPDAPRHDNTTNYDFEDKPPVPDPAFLIPVPAT